MIASISSPLLLLSVSIWTGGSLVDVVNSQRLSPRQVLRVFHQSCLAVVHMHSQRPPIIHRDLKVTNAPRPHSPSIHQWSCDYHWPPGRKPATYFGREHQTLWLWECHNQTSDSWLHLDCRSKGSGRGRGVHEWEGGRGRVKVKVAGGPVTEALTHNPVVVSLSLWHQVHLFPNPACHIPIPVKGDPGLDLTGDRQGRWLCLSTCWGQRGTVSAHTKSVFLQAPCPAPGVCLAQAPSSPERESGWVCCAAYRLSKL